VIVTELFDYEGPLDSAKLIVDTRNAMKVFTPRRSSGSSVLTVSMHRISKVARGSPSTNLNGTYRRWEVVVARGSLARRARSAVVNPPRGLSGWHPAISTRCVPPLLFDYMEHKPFGSSWPSVTHVSGPCQILPNYLFFLTRFFYGLTSSEAGCCCLCQILGHR